MENAALNIGDAVSGLFDIAASALEMVTGNPILFTMFCASLVFTGVSVVKSLKR